MLLEIYLFMEFIVFALFLISFYSREELLWVITVTISGVMMVTSYNIEILNYAWDTISSSYVLVTTSYSYPYLMGLNFIIFALALLFGVFDIWDKFGQDTAERMK